MQHHFPIHHENMPEVTLRWEKLFCCENIEVIDDGDLAELL
jgi:hypothetical protein